MEGPPRGGMGNPEGEPQLTREQQLSGAIDAILEGNIPEADRRFRDVIKAHPDWSVAWHDYAAFRLNLVLDDPSLEEVGLAMGMFLKALALEPKSIRHFYSAAHCAALIPDDALLTRLSIETSRHPDFHTLSEEEQLAIQGVIAGHRSTN